MTAQIHDVVRWKRRTWQLAGVDGQGLFRPEGAGLNPVMLHTACWRGFVCTYGIERRRLELQRLEIGLDPDAAAAASAGTGARLDGRLPASAGGIAWVYDRLTLAVPFSGGLLLGHRFVQHLYVHMGFAPAWKFEEVHEVLFEDGRLVKAADRSEQMTAIRARAAGETPPGRGTSRADVMSWVEGTFDQRYGASRPLPPPPGSDGPPN